MSGIQIIHGDCLERLKGLDTDSVDLICTDPPYGISFLGKDWDKAVPPVAVWRECLRVLKPGGFAFILCTPRQDCLAQMIVRLGEAGFDTSFTSIYWTYASGFPKAGNLGKMADKRAGAEREVVGKKGGRYDNKFKHGSTAFITHSPGNATPDKLSHMGNITVPSTPEAKRLDGSYAGFQPKPAVEPVIVVMKPCAEKTYLDQALANGKGCTWLDDCRIPAGECLNGGAYTKASTKQPGNSFSIGLANGEFNQPSGRFPANLLCQDDVLYDGSVTKSTPHIGTKGGTLGVKNTESGYVLRRGSANFSPHSDSGTYSRFFDIDAWHSALPASAQRTFPWLIVPKPSKREKNEGLEGMPEKAKPLMGEFADNPGRTTPKASATPRANFHPTVKPIKLMKYLVTLGSRPGDIVLDPYCGAGTTGIAAFYMGRQFIGIEIDQEYVEIARRRVAIAYGVDSSDAAYDDIIDGADVLNRRAEGDTP